MRDKICKLPCCPRMRHHDSCPKCKDQTYLKDRAQEPPLAMAGEASSVYTAVATCCFESPTENSSLGRASARDAWDFRSFAHCSQSVGALPRWDRGRTLVSMLAGLGFNPQPGLERVI